MCVKNEEEESVCFSSFSVKEHCTFHSSASQFMFLKRAKKDKSTIKVLDIINKRKR